MLIPQDLVGRSAIVTGAARGLGLEISRALAERGSDVMLLGRNEEALKVAVADLGATCATQVDYFVGDVRDTGVAEAAVSRVREIFGGTNILVNNAQEISVGPLMSLDRDAFESAWTSGPMAALDFMKAAHEDLKDHGVVINLLSGAGIRWDMDNFGAYGAAKQALGVITRTAACEWGPLGIRVLGVMPNARTDAWASYESEFPEQAQEFIGRIPLRRMGAASEVARAIALLCTPTAQYMTGSVVKIDGGLAP